MAVVNEAIHLATAEACVLLAQTGRPVSTIYGLSPIECQDANRSSLALAGSLVDDLWAPWIGLFRDGVLRARTRSGRAARPIGLPT